jgi:hypothetical protein
MSNGYAVCDRKVRDCIPFMRGDNSGPVARWARASSSPTPWTGSAAALAVGVTPSAIRTWPDSGLLARQGRRASPQGAIARQPASEPHRTGGSICWSHW